MKLLHVVWKDLLLIVRDKTAVITLLLVPIVVIFFVAESQSRGRSPRILLPVVDEDQGPVANALIRVLDEHLEVRVVERPEAERLVKEEHEAAALLVLPRGTSKRYLTERPSKIELLTDPAQFTALQAIKVVLLLADREAATLGDPFSEELLTIEERSLTGKRLKFSSVEQNVPGFSLMFVLLSLVYGVAFGMHDETGWRTLTRLRTAPVSEAVVLGGKVIARGIVGSVQLGLLLAFGHLVYGISLGRAPGVLLLVAVVIAFSLAAFSVVVAALARTREQVLPVGLAVVFILATLGGCFWPYSELPEWMQTAAHAVITSWSMFSIHDVMLRERGLLDVLPKLGVIAGYGLVSFAVATRLYRYSDRE